MFENSADLFYGCLTILGLFFFWMAIGFLLNLVLHMSVSVAYGVSFVLMAIVAFFLAKENMGK